jgi:hypothetical protein
MPNASQGAVSVPRAAAGLDPVGRGNRRERIRHPDLGPVRLEHERVGVVEPAERRLGLVAELIFQLRERGRARELDEPPVDVVADLEIALGHQPTTCPDGRGLVPGMRTRPNRAKRLQVGRFVERTEDVSAVRFGARHKDTPRS